MLREFRTDLHVHTCLSPCGDLSMSPRKIVAEVLRQGINIIAVTDHNSAANIGAVTKAAEGAPVVVLAGMEICTREEAHVLAIFDNETPALKLQSVVYNALSGVNNPDVFGLQVMANELDEVEGFEERLLIGATDLSVEDVVRAVHKLGGLAIAAHIDRESYSVIGQLGFIPRAVTFDALEVSELTSDKDARTRFSDYMRYVFVRNSDAHTIDRIGAQTTRFLLEAPTASEIGKALRCEDGRKLVSVETRIDNRQSIVR
ncbi:MAG: PHP domain-containing protein [Ignavibacteriae bacterium]|nr:PHP domain-containing protein [Ignavibacteriota bacterium]